MDFFNRMWRALSKKYGLSSPPTTYHLDAAPSPEVRLMFHQTDVEPWERITHDIHSFIAESRKKICICSMTPEYHRRLYTPEVITRLDERIEHDGVEVCAIVSPLTQRIFEDDDIACRVRYSPVRDFILFDNARALMFQDSRAFVYYTLNDVPLLRAQFHRLYEAARPHSL